MLQFFRKYQKFFFFFVTIIIVTSFVFFGTYQAFAPTRGGAEDEVVFVAKDGSKVRRLHFYHLCQHLSDEGEENLLNDGFISRTFLQTKMGELLFLQNQESCLAELEERNLREKNYQPYQHPHFSALSANAIWKIFAPEIPVGLEKLKMTTQSGSVEGFKQRATLYLAEKKFPAHMLSQVIRYQEQDKGGMASDPRLANISSLALFGYHNLNDWFGKNYVEACAKAIINTACVAREEGISVTLEEAKADVMTHVEKIFAKHEKDLPPQISDSNILFALMLREKGCDEETFLTLWSEMLLFNRLMDFVSASVTIDSLAMKEFYSQAGEKIVCEVFRLPKEFRFKNQDDLALFETYLSAVSKRSDLLSLPTQFESAKSVEEKFPALVAHPFRLEVAHVSAKERSGKISVRETWEWEKDEKNWVALKEKFPYLTDLSMLDQLDSKKRAAIDQFARVSILKAQPNWVSAALKEAKKEEKKVVIRGSGKVDLPGIKDGLALKELLAKENELSEYSQDEQNFYSIKVLERSPKEVVTFLEAKESNLLEKKSDLAKLSQLLQEEMKEENATGDVAPYRFVAYMKGLPTAEKVGIGAQWNLEKKEESVSRGTNSLVSFVEAKVLDVGQFSKVSFSQEEGPYFYKVVEKKIESTLPMDKMLEAQKMLGLEARELFFEKLLAKIAVTK